MLYGNGIVFVALGFRQRPVSAHISVLAVAGYQLRQSRKNSDTFYFYTSHDILNGDGDKRKETVVKLPGSEYATTSSSSDVVWIPHPDGDVGHQEKLNISRLKGWKLEFALPDKINSSLEATQYCQWVRSGYNLALSA